MIQTAGFKHMTTNVSPNSAISASAHSQRPLWVAATTSLGRCIAGTHILVLFHKPLDSLFADIHDVLAADLMVAE